MSAPVTITRPPCGKVVQPRLGPPWTCNEDLRCDTVNCVRLGDALVGFGYAHCEFSDAWSACLAWNLTLASLLCAAAERASARAEMLERALNQREDAFHLACDYGGVEDGSFFGRFSMLRLRVQERDRALESHEDDCRCETCKVHA